MRLLLSDVFNFLDFLCRITFLINQKKRIIILINIIQIQSVILVLRQNVTSLDFIDTNYERVSYFI